MRRLARPVLVILGLLAVLTVLLAGAATPDVAEQQRVLRALNAVYLHGAALQRDVLKARAGLLRNYDPLVEATTGLRAATTELGLRTAAAGRGRDALATRAADLAAAAAAQEDLVETFKARNALLQNSLSYVRLASLDLGASRGDQRDAGAVEVAALANALLSFLGEPTARSAAPVAASLDRLEAMLTGPHRAQERRGLVAHTRLILATLPDVDGLLTQLLATPIEARARTLQAAYLEQQGRATARARVFRVLLYCVSLLLLGYLGRLLWRLRANARLLQARLQLERLIAGLSAAVVDLPAGGADEAIAGALRRLGTHLGVDRAYLLWGEAPGRRWLWQAEAAPPVPPEATAALAGEVPPPGEERHGCFAVDRTAALPSGAPRALLEAQGSRSWLGVPLWQAGERAGLLGFDTVQGERPWLAEDVALLRTAGEILAGAIARGEAAAERQALETRLRQTQRMEAVGTLAGGIAHDFNNILGAILGYAEMALAALPADAGAARHVRQVVTAGERAMGVVDQILAFSRRGDASRQPMPLEPVVREALAMVRASLPPSVGFAPRLEAAGAVVLGEPGQVQRVVINLCTNAAQAMGGRGSVGVALATVELPHGRALSHGTLAPGRYARLAVSDTGPGIEPAVLERVFEPFFTTKPEGTGLGLATTHGIVADHGGALNVASRPGAGSTFEAYFALADAAATPPEPGRPAARGRGETVLLVDDEEALLLLGEEMLAALGYEPVGFESGKAALAAFRAAPQRFDLVLADEVMADMTGTELARAVRALRPELPILLMTGHAGAVQAPGRRAGVREILRKPLSSRAIADSLARHLRGG